MSVPIANVLSHWAKAFPLCTMSSNAFYIETEKAIKVHNPPETKIKRVHLGEASYILCVTREYLRITRDGLTIDVCAAAFGKDFFVSWWLYEPESMLRQIFGNTRLGNFFSVKNKSRTFYQIDSEEIFCSCIHNCVLEVLEAMTESKGIRTLRDDEKLYIKGGV